MDKYLHRINIKSKYIHSDVDTLERGKYCDSFDLEIDVLVGGKSFEKGLDLPRFLVAILDADKAQNERSLTANGRKGCKKR